MLCATYSEKTVSTTLRAKQKFTRAPQKFKPVCTIPVPKYDPNFWIWPNKRTSLTAHIYPGPTETKPSQYYCQSFSGRTDLVLKNSCRLIHELNIYLD